MSKVLISFVGTGPFNNIGKPEREYRETIYNIEGKDSTPTPFIADALIQHFGINKVILVGTPHSMWEGLYYVMANRNGCFNDDVYMSLWQYCDVADQNSALNIPHQKEIELSMCVETHIELIHYGLNTKEIEKNEEVILSLEKYLNYNDEVYFDVTHSFRSLPMFAMNLMVYLKNVCQKNIKIRSISYGMYEAKSEREIDGQKYTIAPVVELSNVLDIHEWIIGAYNFTQFGRGYKIAELIEKEGDTSVANVLREFSNVMNLNNLTDVRNQYRKLDGLKNKRYSTISSRIVPKTLEAFTKSLPLTQSDAVFLFNVAKWHYNHLNFSSAYISLSESILTFVCESAGIPSQTSNDMDLAKQILDGKKNDPRDSMRITEVNHLKTLVPHLDTLKEIYHKIYKIRNGLAHQTEVVIKYRDDHGRMHEDFPNTRNMIKILEESINKLKSIIK